MDAVLIEIKDVSSNIIVVRAKVKFFTNRMPYDPFYESSREKDQLGQ
jgi:hypothetical protein